MDLWTGNPSACRAFHQTQGVPYGEFVPVLFDSCDTGSRSLNRFSNDFFRLGRVAVKPIAKFVPDGFLDE